MSARDAAGQRSRRNRRARRDTFAEQTAGSAPPPDSPAWRRVHKISPLLNIWQVVVILVSVGIFNVAEYLRDIGDLLDWAMQNIVLILIVIAGVLLLAAVITGIYSILAWQRMKYAIDETAVYFHQGILTKEQRVARLNRIQAVDVVQPLLGRIFGLARVVVETAGGGDSQVKIQYLALAEAKRVRHEILTRAAGRWDDATGGTGTQPDQHGASSATPVAVGEGTDQIQVNLDLLNLEFDDLERQREVYRVNPGLLIASSLLDTGMIVSIFVLIGMAVGIFLLPFSFGAFFAMVPAILGISGYVLNRVAGEWGLKAAVAPEGIRLKRGLLQTTSQTLPPGRVQAVRLRQGLIWRLMGWWRVQVNVAGYGVGDDEGGVASSQTVLLPVGDRDTALTALWLVVSDLGVEDPRPVIDAALAGGGTDAGFLISPQRAKWLDPLTYRHNGLLLTRTATIVRQGRFTRTVTVVPHERLQSVAVNQGPWERRLGLANFESHSVPGPISVIMAQHLDAADAARVLDIQAQRARTARAKEDPSDWDERVGVPGAGVEGQ